MLSRGALGNLVNRYKAVLSKCRLINTFGSLAVAAMLVAGGAATAEGAVSAGYVINGSDKTFTGDIDYTDAVDIGVYANGATANFSGSNLSISTTPGLGWGSGNVGLWATVSEDTRSIINFGQAGVTKSINIDVQDTSAAEDIAIGVWASGDTSGNNLGGLINLNAEEVVIRGHSDNGWIYGIYGQNSTTNSTKDLATVNINAGKTYVDVSAGTAENAIAIVAMSQGRVNIEGDLYVNTLESSKGSTAIVARGDAVVSINKGSAHTVQMNGDIDFNYHDGTSGTKVDAVVDVNLSGADSYWNGNTTVSWGEDNKPDDDKLSVTGMTLGLANGAVWTPTKVTNSVPTASSGTMYAALNYLNMDNGVVNLNKGVDVEVGKLSGSGTVNLAADLKEGESAGTFKATNAAEGAALAVNLTGVTADDLTAKEATALVANVSSTDKNLSVTGNVEEGLVNGALTIGSDGVSMGKNHVMESALEIASITSLSLDRILNNDIRKRMGDLRSVTGDTGVWMRWDGGRLKGDSGLTNDFNTVQVGVDTLTAWDNVRVGLAGSFTYGDGDHKRGSSDMEGVAVAAYGVWMADNGMFADVIARLGSFNTDVKLAGYDGSIDSMVASLSGEFGWRFNLYERFYLEPQLELAYTYVDGDTFSLGSARYDVDNTDSLIGRAGVSAGWKLPGDRGDIYARASVVQQFLGDAKISGQNNGMMNVYEIDGEDTWFEYGIGTNVRLTEKASLWADVERTEGAQIDEEWRGTVGLRYSF